MFRPMLINVKRNILWQPQANRIKLSVDFANIQKNKDLYFWYNRNTNSIHNHSLRTTPTQSTKLHQTKYHAVLETYPSRLPSWHEHILESPLGPCPHLLTI